MDDLNREQAVAQPYGVPRNAGGEFHSSELRLNHRFELAVRTSGWSARMHLTGFTMVHLAPMQ